MSHAAPQGKFAKRVGLEKEKYSQLTNHDYKYDSSWERQMAYWEALKHQPKHGTNTWGSAAHGP
jgi:hypothetical protein